MIIKTEAIPILIHGIVDTNKVRDLVEKGGMSGLAPRPLCAEKIVFIRTTSSKNKMNYGHESENDKTMIFLVGNLGNYRTFILNTLADRFNVKVEILSTFQTEKLIQNQVPYFLWEIDQEIDQEDEEV